MHKVRFRFTKVAAPASLSRDGRTASYAAAMALFTAIVVGYFAPVIFRGEIVLPSGFVYWGDPVYSGSTPAELDVRMVNPIMGGDRVFQFHPWLVFNARALRNGDFPLWNPYSSAGTPHLALDQSAVLDPLSTGAGLVVGGERAGSARAVLSVWLAGIGLLAFARRRGLSAPAGLLAVLAFSFGGWFILWLDRPMSAAACWLPWILWGIDRMVRTDRPAAGALAVACFVAFSTFAGHIETTASVLLLAGAFALYESFRARTDRATRLWSAAGTIGALVAGVALAAVLVVPFAEFLLLDAGGPGSRGGATLTAAERLRVGLTGAADPIRVYHTLITAFIPVLNFPGILPYASPPPNLAENTVYIGVVPLTIALLGLSARGRRAQTIFWWIVALVSLGLAFQVPMLNLVNQLPAIRWTNVGRFRMLFAFAAALASSYALDGLRARGRIPRPVALIGVVLLILGAVGTADLLEGAGPNALLPALAGWAAGTLFFLVLSLAPARWWPFAALGLTGAELMLALHAVQPTHPPEQVLPDTPTTAFLRERPGGRIAGFTFEPRIPPLAGALPLLYGLNSQTSYNVLYPERLRALMAEINEDAPWRSPLGEDWLLLADPGDRLVDLLGVRFLITPAGANAEVLEASRLLHQFPAIVSSDGYAAVWENPDPMPQAFLVHEAVDVETAEEAASVLRDPAFDFRQTAVVENPFGESLDLASVGEGADGEVSVVEEGLGELLLRVRSSAPGLLVVTQSYARGWRAEVNDRTVPVRPADLAFLGVAVPPGEHEVRLRYAPASFRIGLVITVATLLALVALVGTERARQRAVRR